MVSHPFQRDRQDTIITVSGDATLGMTPSIYQLLLLHSLMESHIFTSSLQGNAGISMKCPSFTQISISPIKLCSLIPRYVTPDCDRPAGFMLELCPHPYCNIFMESHCPGQSVSHFPLSNRRRQGFFLLISFWLHRCSPTSYFQQ